MEQVEKPLVSICTAVYNHEPFLRECFEGFIMQKTNFAFEVLVHDDASTDGSTNIIREYTAKYPHIFKPIYQQENQYSKGVKVSLKYQYSRAQGKYIALCEGDDYWTDPLKLQKQVDFLEANPEYVLCGHNITAYNERTASFEPFNTGIDGTYELTDLISKGVFCSTLSVVFKRDALVLERYNSYRKVIDITLAYHLLSQGKGYCMNEEMAVYRIHDGGIWSGSNDDARIVTNIEIRTAIYDAEKSDEAATFLEAFLYNLGRLWIIRHLPIFSKTIHRVFLQFGLAHTAKTLMNILSKFSKP